MTPLLRTVSLALGLLLVGMPAVAPAQYTWVRQEATLVTSEGEMIQSPAPPTQPNFSLLQPPTLSVTDNGTNPNELVLAVTTAGPVATKTSNLHLNPSGLAKWLFYGGIDPMSGGELPAQDTINWASGTANALINAGVWHHDGGHPQNPIVLDGRGRFRLNGPAGTTAAVTGRFEYAYAGSATNASWYQYHTGQFRVKRLTFNGQDPPEGYLLDVWHQGLAGFYRWWELDNMGMGQMYMGNQTTIPFSPYGGSLAIDTVAPYGVLVQQDVALTTQPDSMSNFIVLPTIEHIATTGDPLPNGASGSASTSWKLWFVTQGVYTPPPQILPPPPGGGGPPPGGGLPPGGP